MAMPYHFPTFKHLLVSLLKDHAAKCQTGLLKLHDMLQGMLSLFARLIDSCPSAVCLLSSCPLATRLLGRCVAILCP